MDCKIGMMKHRRMVVMLMNNRDYVNDSIEFDQMDVGVDDGRRLREVVENRGVENPLHPSWMKWEWMGTIEYLFG